MRQHSFRARGSKGCHDQRPERRSDSTRKKRLGLGFDDTPHGTDLSLLALSTLSGWGYALHMWITQPRLQYAALEGYINNEIYSFSILTCIISVSLCLTSKYGSKSLETSEVSLRMHCWYLTTDGPSPYKNKFCKNALTAMSAACSSLPRILILSPLSLLVTG